MNSEQKRRAKKTAKRKAHNKAFRLQREKEAIAKRQQKRDITSINEFAAKYVHDSIAIIQYREQFSNSVRGMIKVIENAKATNPAQFSNLSSDAFTKLLEKLQEKDELFKKLGATAAKIESQSKIDEKMLTCMEGISTLSDAQMAIMEISGEFSLIETNMRELLSGKKPVPEELDKPEDVEFEDAPAETDLSDIEMKAAAVSSPRTHDDYEVEFPAELAVEGEK